MHRFLPLLEIKPMRYNANLTIYRHSDNNIRTYFEYKFQIPQKTAFRNIVQILNAGLF